MCIGILEMLHIDRTGGFEGNDVNKTSASKECDICHYWYFLNCISLSVNQICLQ